MKPILILSKQLGNRDCTFRQNFFRLVEKKHQFAHIMCFDRRMKQNLRKKKARHSRTEQHEGSGIVSHPLKQQTQVFQEVAAADGSASEI